MSQFKPNYYKHLVLYIIGFIAFSTITYFNSSDYRDAIEIVVVITILYSLYILFKSRITSVSIDDKAVRITIIKFLIKKIISFEKGDIKKQIIKSSSNIFEFKKLVLSNKEGSIKIIIDQRKDGWNKELLDSLIKELDSLGS